MVTFAKVRSIIKSCESSTSNDMDEKSSMLTITGVGYGQRTSSSTTTQGSVSRMMPARHLFSPEMPTNRIFFCLASNPW